jgi:hypothetical protein
MKAKLVTFSILLFVSHTVFAQNLPVRIKNYLNENYKGWKLSPSKQGCGDETNNGVVKGNFNADKKIDYAVKFTRGKKGYIIAFLAQKQNYKAFVLHNYSAEEANTEYLTTYKSGEIFKYNKKSIRLNFDAPSDYFCESDDGGIHLYRNGKFIGY